MEELYQDYVEGTSMKNIEARVKCDLDRVGNMEKWLLIKGVDIA